MSFHDATPVDRIATDVSDLRASFDAGKTRPLAARKRVLAQIQAMVRDGEAALVAALQADMHKPAFESYLTELGLIAAEVQTHLDYLDDWAAPQATSTSIACFPGRSFTVADPLGVTCIFGTWNYPVHVTILPLVGAISAGNTAVVRLAADGSVDETNAVLAKLLDTYVDKDVVRVVKGGLDQSKALLAQRFDLIFCTGGPVIGKAVARAAAEHLTPVVLELGGKSPAIVDATADIEVTARRVAWGAFINGGQTCVRPDHVYVAKEIGDAFVAALKRAIVSMFSETPETSDMYAHVANMTQFYKMKAWIDKEKAYVVHGGTSDASSRCVTPTVFNYKADMAAFAASALMEDELFGPLLPLVYFDDVDAVLARVRAQPKPLALYIFSTHESTIDTVVSTTTSGSMCINDCIMQMGNHSLPFGGVGPSGMGAYHGHHSFTCFSHTKAVLKKYFWLDLPQRYMPYTPSSMAVLRAGIAVVPRAVVRRIVALLVVLALAWLLQRPKIQALLTYALQVCRQG